MCAQPLMQSTIPVLVESTPTSLDIDHNQTLAIKTMLGILLTLV